ncbi:MAG: DUF3103 domain-containing protein [Bacteroidales bacterium]|jgi:hypothetical protein|nr:DUF3103 domain-containing protein [Bacteroidales bacterium]
MRKNILILLLIGAFVFSACQKEDSVNTPKKKSDDVLINKEKVTLNIIQAVNESGSLAQLKTELKNTTSVRLTDIGFMEDNSSHAVKAINSEINEKSYLAEAKGIIQVPELWIIEGTDPAKKNITLFSYAPDGNEKDWEFIKAYNLDGKEFRLDVNKAPEYSVIVLEPDGQFALKETVKRMNQELKALNVQVERPATRANGLETTVLESVHLSNDQEPWIKGGAEIYAICTGIVEKNGQKNPQVRIIEMPYLDHDNKWYYPNQVMLFWKDYDYQAANVQFFEHDSNYNYKKLTQILVDGLFKIVSAATGEPIVAIVGNIASAVIEVIPDSFFTDDDDYVDSYYTLMKNQTYRNRKGAAQNATATFKPLFIPNN